MTEPPPGSGSRGDESVSYPGQRYALPTENIHAPYFEVRPCEDPEGFDYSDWCHDSYEPHANKSDPASYALQGDGIKPGKGVPRTKQQLSTPPDDDVLRCGVEKRVEPSGSAAYGDQTHVARPSYNVPLAPRTDFTETPAHMQNTSYYARDTPPPARPSGSKYGPYQGRFASPEDASQHRKEATRFNRKPYRPPDSDPTIAEVERDRLYHVERIYDAMTRGDAARDNKGSIAMKRWVHGAYYDSALVEAYAHKVLDCLLLQAKDGFRGWVHNDYVADDRKGEDEDRDVTCAERLESILRALQEEKTICEDVMNSACQIRMFVNAPKAYANRKYQNRVGNSKRGRPKDSEANEPSSKVRKLNARPVTRPRRAGSNLLATSSPPARLQSQTPELSPLQRSHLRFSTPPQNASPGLTGLPQLAPMQAPSLVHHRITAMSQVGSPHHPRLSTMPPQHQSPLMSPPPLSHGHRSAPATPEDAQLVHNLNIEPWHPSQPYVGTFYPGDEPLFDNPWSWPSEQQGQVCTGLNANLFAQHPDAASLSPRQQASGANAGTSNFQEFWESQHGVQPLPYRQDPESHETRAGSRP